MESYCLVGSVSLLALMKKSRDGCGDHYTIMHELNATELYTYK